MNVNRRAEGSLGERAAAEEYVRRGWRVLDRNRHLGRYGELDLVLVKRDGDVKTVCFCEVKTRSRGGYGRPCEAVGPKKQIRIRFLAECYLQEHSELKGADVRFDVAEVYRDTAGTPETLRVEILENAF